ncbi:hypothetical protein BDB00DRAFT_873551 [Zychaea mexicana]|uniref:uncharacterized protein n=1 Tax=Zychaea mexicana TaxID=64656 RepID=UPI0022FE4B46|nr:uncharacterized protein BDB00DRAFT_873551 [Zychaea mexicana]KAI9492283.1 hypothetical protein BDB00DRAFT_873551 [Zychaea mexicana]
MPETEEDSSFLQTIEQYQQGQSSLRTCEAIPRHSFKDEPVGDDDSPANGCSNGSNINSTTVANDDIMNTPALSPPSSPKLGICPDKGLNRDEDDDDDEEEDTDSGIFRYEEHLRPHHQHHHKHHQGDQQPSESIVGSYKIRAVDQEQLDHDKESINYFYRDFDADNDNIISKNNELEQSTTTNSNRITVPLSSSSSVSCGDCGKEDNNSNNNKRQKQQEQSISTAAGTTNPFDLTAFAHQLYENRLSVVHSRESKLVLTEQDELEFAKLMEIRRKSLAAARHQQRQEQHENQQQKAETEEEGSATIMAEEEYACEKIEWNEPIDFLRKDQEQAFPSNLIIAASTTATNTSTNHDDGATLIESSQATAPRFSSSSSPTTVPSTPVSPKPTRSRGFSLQKLRNPIENSASWLPKKKLSRLSDNSVKSNISSTSASSFLSSASSSNTTATTTTEAAAAANHQQQQQQVKQSTVYNDSDKILVEEEEDNTGLNADKKAVEAEDEGQEQKSHHSGSESSGSRKSSSASRSSRFKELTDFDVGQVATDLVAKEPALTLSNNNNQNAPSSNQKQQKQHQKHQESSSNQPTGTSRSKSLNLFGTLRNRARSQSTPSIKGLMRNLSTVSVIPQRSNTQPQLSQQLQEEQQQQVKKKRSHSALSPAAIAVLKHNAESKKAGAAAASDQGDKLQIATPTAENHNQSKGKRMLSQLLSTARISRRQVPKKVNMEEDAAPTRAQIVRRTIIYVKPDSENFLKNIENAPPPVPSIPSGPNEVQQQQEQRQRTRSSTPDSDEDVASRQTATMITRQTSVKRQISKRRNNTSNNDANEQKEKQQEEQQQRPTAQQELEGVEVREMSDGSVVWGVVKKQGKRKSFFAASDNVYESKFEIDDPQALHHKEEEEDEDQIEERVLALMGLRPDLLKNYPANNDKLPPPPIPKRSPHRVQQQQQQHHHHRSEATHISSYSNRRDSSTIDIYYAHGATLPNLLQMISDPADEELPREKPTVEEQLDEVMRSLGYTDGQTL